ncbi:MAG: hypothetical protein DWQ01_20850 [Planctomycetota bacterium]|nr:MAG: hypothetical protein DWQ01_20850 [Planctomycetota bacterium]
MLSTLALLLAWLPSVQEPEAGFDLESLKRKVEEITPIVAELRGWEFKHGVKAGVHTPEQFLVYAKKEFEEEYGLEQFRATGRAYGLIGLVPVDLDLFQAFMDLLRSQVGGYYDPKSDTFYMISTFNQGGLADIIMAHELTHALDDQYFHLDKMMSSVQGNADAEFAVRAVVEGSGTSLMNLYTQEGMMKGFLQLDMAQMTEMMAEQAEMLNAMPPYLVMTLALPYLEGNKFLVQESNALMAATKAPSDEELKRAFQNPPLSSEQVLHFEKYWDPKKRDDPTVIKLPDFSKDLGEGWKLVDENVLGELGCYCLTEENLPNMANQTAQLTAKWTNAAATGWDGDLYQYYQGPGNAGLVVSASVWDSVKDAQEFSGAVVQILQKRNPALREIHLSRGNAALLFFANDQGSAKKDVLKKAVLDARPDWR